MGIVVEDLSKSYGGLPVVDSVSFEVKRGEIFGLLGPNGAGKSTTMKIMVGALPSSKGKVYVDDYDVATSPLQVKKITGYLAENNPLYEEMYVHEYLRFVGRLYKVKGNVLNRKVAEVVVKCGLQPEQNKRIELLSKGYKQRVGLAQILLHDPSVLILDEPTSGLDPNQIREVRTLIKEISATKTVVLSTHVMQEVQAICDRVLILNKGKVVVNEKMDTLNARQQSLEEIFQELTEEEGV